MQCAYILSVDLARSPVPCFRYPSGAGHRPKAEFSTWKPNDWECPEVTTAAEDEEPNEAKIYTSRFQPRSAPREGVTVKTASSRPKLR